MKLLTVSVLFSLAASLQAQRDPILEPANMRKVTPHVYVIEDKDTVGGVPNVGIIVGSRAVLVVDTGMGPRNGKIILDQVEKVAPEGALYLVTTHVHPEHDLGAEAFPPSTKMIRSADQEEDIKRHGYDLAKVFMSRNAINKELLEGAKFRPADIHFTKDYDLDLGGVSVHIFAAGPDHTLGDTAVWVGSEHVLFSGDVAMRGLPAVISPESSVNHWLISLKDFEALKPAYVVPSHGPIGEGTGYITNYQNLFVTVRDRAAALKKQGQTQEQAVATLTSELKDKYPDTNRVSGAVKVAYKEAP